ncbi:hypothetical protein N7490_001185 [Penicillium lividum]|nr:hypothetical protein N7490_001185 [Penicillium lividum]
MQPRMRYDDTAWEKSEEVAENWVRQLIDPEVLSPVGEFLVKHHRPDDPEVFTVLPMGSFNVAFRMRYKTGSAVIRFPQPGAVMFPEEKVRNEVAVMRYIREQTSIPIPLVLHWGPKTGFLLELSPFIIMDYIEHDTCMYDVLNTPGCPKQERGILDPDINEEKLEALYAELAGVILQLSRPSLPRIGSLAQIDDCTWDVIYRPLSMPMNDLIQLGSLPQSKLPQTTFETASSYFEALAELHIEHLINQRNDAIHSADDCRRKFVARYLFRRLARGHTLTKKSSDKGPFKLWCDDFRPGNVLMNNLKIAGVVDWEFTYAAPVEFSHAPPWWLLIEKPEYWPQGLDHWCTEYERRFVTFLRAMRSHEDEEIEEAPGCAEEDQRLSDFMRDSWESGDFWIVYAARNSFAFDAIFWQKIDQRFFGTTTCVVEDVWKERLDLLEPEEKEEMEKYVALKLVELDTRVLAWDPDKYTLELLETRTVSNEEDESDQTEADEIDDVVSDKLAELLV